MDARIRTGIAAIVQRIAALAREDSRAGGMKVALPDAPSVGVTACLAAAIARSANAA
jgi:hypothetical protein